MLKNMCILHFSVTMCYGKILLFLGNILNWEVMTTFIYFSKNLCFLQTLICLHPFYPVVPDVSPQIFNLLVCCLLIFLSLLDQHQLLQKLEVFSLLLHRLLGQFKTTSLPSVDRPSDVVNPSERRWKGRPRRKELGLEKDTHINIF